MVGNQAGGGAPVVEVKNFIGGRWTEAATWFKVTNKYTGAPVGRAAVASSADVDAAVKAAEAASRSLADWPAHRRSEFLARTSAGLQARHEEIARVIAAEAGKALKYARAEVDRAVSTFEIAAEEAKRIHGETVPLDAVPSGTGYFGFWTRRPLGVVGAITPFNFPVNLVAHKIAPAIAAANAVVLKPADKTPISAALLAQVMQEAGLPDGALNVVNGPGPTVGRALVSHGGVAKITFTGSAAVGQEIVARAGLKRVTLELGNAAPVVIAADADLDLAAERCAVGAYYNSGQVCISVQRIYVHEKVADAFAERFVEASQRMVVGDPLDERVDVGPMIAPSEVQRISGWVADAVASGAEILTGGRGDGSVYSPTVLHNVALDSNLIRREAFAPVASVVRCGSFQEALALADDTDFGLQASVFTQDIDRALQAVEALNFGGVIINEGPNFRADHMPYGGNRRSGIGREGLRYAIEEMTNRQMVVIKRK